MKRSIRVVLLCGAILIACFAVLLLLTPDQAVRDVRQPDEESAMSSAKSSAQADPTTLDTPAALDEAVAVQAEVPRLPERLAVSDFEDMGDTYSAGAENVGLVRAQHMVTVTYEVNTDLELLKQAAAALGFSVADHNDKYRVVVLEASSARSDLISSAVTLPGVVYADWLYGTQDKQVPVIVTPRMMLRMKNGDAQEYARTHGLKLIEEMRGLPDVYVMEVASFDSVDSVLHIAAARARDPEVAWAEPDFITKYELHSVPDDTYYPQQWHLHPSSFHDHVTNAHIHAEDAWDITRGSTSIVVAVLDTSVDWLHPDLTNSIFINYGEYGGGKESNALDDDGNGYTNDWHGWDFKSGDNNPGIFGDAQAHGTPVAGLIAAEGSNTLGVTGVAPLCQILPVRIGLGIDWTSDSDVVEALNYAKQFADVLNNSWGGSTHKQSIVDAVNDAVTNGRGGKGCVVLFSSGNDDGELNYQAKLDSVLAVGASDYRDRRVYYSNYGPALDLMAPSRGIFAGIWSTDHVGTNSGKNVQWGWHEYTYALAAGTHTLRWEYAKGAEDTAGWDTSWLDDIALPGGDVEDFETGSLTNWPWSTDGDTNWVVDGINVHGGIYAAMAADISDSESTYLEVITNLPDGDVTFWYYVSSDSGDRLRFYDNGSNMMYASGISGDADGDYLDAFAGTSASCPIASGVAALLLSEYPHLLASEVMMALRQSADKVGQYSYDQFGHNIRLGYGRVNAKRMLEGPTIVSVPSPTGVVGEAYAYDADSAAEAVGLGDITWYTNRGPSGFTINETNGVISWTPTVGGWITLAIRAESTQGTNVQIWEVHLPQDYYINDTTTANDVYCPAIGDDANSGQSSNAPKARLDDLLETYRLGPGDTVYIDTGYYELTDTPTVTNSGTEEAYITFQGSPNGTVMDRGGIVGGYSPLRIEKQHHVQAYDLELVGGQYALYGNRAHDCRFERIKARDAQDGLYFYFGTNITLRQVAAWGCTDDGIDFHGGRGANVLESSSIGHNDDDQVDMSFNTGQLEMRNNVLYADGADDYCINRTGGTYLGDFNDFYCTNGAFVGYYSGTRTNLSDWQAEALQDTTSLDEDPTFVASDDLRLNLGSPCIDAGTNQSWMSGATDIDGNERIVWASVDMGAFENDWGAGDPVINITNEDAIVGFDTTATDIGGTNNIHLDGQMWWTNALTGSNDVLEAVTPWTITNIYLAEGTNAITVWGTNMVRDVTHDVVTITRGGVGTGAPIVDATNGNETVSYETLVIDVGGTNNDQVVGQLVWTNALNGDNGIIAAADSWLIDDLSLTVGTNVITILATNAISDSDSDSVNIIRSPAGSGVPVIVVTNENETVSYDTTMLTIGGTNNPHLVGTVYWTNALNGGDGRLDADADWDIPGILLDVGANVITVSGTNSVGAWTNDSVSITREGPGQEAPVISISTLPASFTYDVVSCNIDGTKNDHVLGTMTWTNELNAEDGAFAATLPWSISDVALAVGSNRIVVSGTNLVGVVTNDSVLMIRGEPGTGIPIVDITNENAAVDSDVGSIDIGGTNNANVVGTMWWTNGLTGGTGTFGDFPGSDTNWLITNIALDVGINTIWVYGTNSTDMPGADFVVIMRRGLTHYVAPGGSHSTPYTNWVTAATTIQAAVNVAGPGGTVLVSNGLYNTGGVPTPRFSLTNRLTITNAITVCSMGGADVTTIAGQGPAGSNAVRCVYMTNGAELIGFTLTNGFTDNDWMKDITYDQGGGGVLLDYGGMVSSCVIRQNYAAADGGGVLCNEGGLLSDCVVTGNTAFTSGGGVFMYFTGTLVRCSLLANEAGQGGAGIKFMGGGMADHCVVKGNACNGFFASGGGAYLDMGGEMRNCLVVTNTADSMGGGVYLAWGGVLLNCTVADNVTTGAFGSSGGVVFQMGGRLTNCIVYHNEAPMEANWNTSAAFSASFAYTCITPTNELMTDPGNITNVPQFVSRSAGNYRLLYGSPCLEVGTTIASVPDDLDGVARPQDGDYDGTNYYDMGAYEYDPATYDSDADWMPDWWELRHELNPLDPGDATGHGDADTVQNLNEYISDTDPTNSVSYFRIEAVRASDSNTVTFLSSSNRLYSMQRTMHIVTGTWSGVEGQTTIVGSGVSATLSDTNESSGAYYRVEVELP